MTLNTLIDYNYYERNIYWQVDNSENREDSLADKTEELLVPESNDPVPVLFVGSGTVWTCFWCSRRIELFHLPVPTFLFENAQFLCWNVANHLAVIQ